MQNFLNQLFLLLFTGVSWLFGERKLREYQPGKFVQVHLFFFCYIIKGKSVFFT